MLRRKMTSKVPVDGSGCGQIDLGETDPGAERGRNQKAPILAANALETDAV